MQVSFNKREMLHKMTKLFHMKLINYASTPNTSKYLRKSDTETPNRLYGDLGSQKNKIQTYLPIPM